MKHSTIKKFLVFVFTIVMISSLIPGSVFAEDKILPEQTEIVSQASEVETFPKVKVETEETVSMSEENDEDNPNKTEEEPVLEKTLRKALAKDAEQTPVNYLDRNGGSAECKNYVVLHNQDTLTELSAAFYVVFDDIAISHSLKVKGNVSLILADGCHLKLTGSLSIPAGGNSLTIYAQSTDEETMGAMEVDASYDSGKAGIEVKAKSSGLTICGGNVTAIAGSYAAGIGGNENSDSGSITIYNGKVKAIGGGYGAGIGGGRNGDCKNVTICGGKVIATGGRFGAGIGGGYEGDSVNTITISGGHVEATGGHFSAGIGGGYYGNANIVKITGGETVANGTEGGAGIGGGEEAQFGTGGEFEEFVYTGGTVRATATPDYRYDKRPCGMAIGAGADGDDDVKYTFSLGNEHLLINNETGKIVDIAFYADFSQVLHGYGRKQSCNLSIVPTSAYPVSYLTQNEYGETVSAECKENYKLFYYNRNYTLMMPSGWYVMTGEGEYENGIEIQGDVHLILTDGCKLTVRNGIRIGKGAELTIYGQSEGDTAGKLISYGTYYRAGIGGSGNSRDGGTCGKLAIRGGNVIADGSYDNGAGACSGIGGICNQPGIKPVEFSMYGGVLTAVGRYGSPGIGGCRNAPGGIVNIYGGTINAESRNHGYSSMTNRAIGGYLDNPDNGTIYVGKNVVLIDNKTGKQITKGPGEKWVDKFAASSISITATTDAQPVSYMYYDETTGTYETGICEKYISYDGIDKELKSGWYVLDGDCTFDQEIGVYGDVHLILKDGCKATFGHGINIYSFSSSTLSIYSQSLGNDMGEMDVFCAAYTGADNGKAGIRTTSGTHLYVHGGKITAEGANWGAGIGGGSDMKSLISERGGNVTVYGGLLEGIGGNGAAGIGGGAGERGNGGTLTIIGGTVIAKGSGSAAGVGGGQKSAGGTVNLYGGTLKSTGGNFDGHAIGCGAKASNNGTINVKEGFILIDNDTNEEIKNEDGKAWTEILTGEVVNIRIEKKPDYDPTEDERYQIVHGSGSVWTKGSKEGLVFVSNAEFELFDSVRIDGKTISSDYYSAKEGSTMIILNPSFIETLNAGVHSMEIVSKDGHAKTSFTISSKISPETPATGDDSHVLLWMLLFVAGLMLVISAVYIAKKNF